VFVGELEIEALAALERRAADRERGRFADSVSLSPDGSSLVVGGERKTLSVYIAVYRVTEQAVEISRIFRGAQDWP